jgi:exonuclease III
MASLVINIACFNMRGFNNGANMTADLCNSHKIIALQEHWLRPDGLNKLSMINEDFSFFASSGMEKSLSLNLLRGRSYGGVGFLFHNSLSNCLQLIGCDSSNRCIAIKCTVHSKPLILFNVYLPCFENTLEYRDEICAIAGFIENVMNNESNSDVLIMGDTNFDTAPGHVGFDIFNSLLSSLNMLHCDDLILGSDNCTYHNEALHASSRIDHFFISSHLKPCITHFAIIDSGINLSDHRPLSLSLSILGEVRSSAVQFRSTKKKYNVRWDKGSLADYYALTNVNLANSNIDFSYLHCRGKCCSQDAHLAAIENHYASIVSALQLAELDSIPRIPHQALKPFWTEYLDELKSKSILWHDIWISAGRPSSGIIHKIKLSCKLKYKLAIKEAFIKHECRYNDELHSHFLNKKIPDFWKSWNKKMHCNVTKEVYVNGSNDEKVVADAFADSFEAIYFDSNSNDSAKKEFNQLLLSNYNSHTVSQQELLTFFSVEQIDRCIRSLKLGKASGPDDLSAEHLLHAHPSLVVHLRLLFCGLATHCYVPDDFGSGIIIPLLKDKLGKINDLGNYRGITLIPVISKLFELVLLEICKPYLCTDDLQFGFKERVGCPDAIFLLSETIDYFSSRGSSIFMAALDFKKAFDRVHHFKLFSSLIRAHIPIWIILTLINWYGKLRVAVRWKLALSRTFSVHSGVRQGSSFSPALFTVFINIFITKLKACNRGCVINSHFVGAIMYADDLILLSASIEGLQIMLNICNSVSLESLMEFNCNKCTCSVVGPASRLPISDMQLGSDKIHWADSFKYLGIPFITGKSLTVDTQVIKRKFFASCNCILGNVTCLSEIIKLSMVETFSLPILLFAVAALKLSKLQINELNACWNAAYRRIFGFNKWESVRAFINGLGRLDFSHLRLLLHLK